MSQVTTVEPTAGSSTGDTATRALGRISVGPPYFDLREMEELGEGIVSATIASAPVPHPEIGAIEAAQVARHLAILGSCAAALSRDDDDRHHYLATKAHYTRLSNAPTAVHGPLRAEAIASWSDRRSARALVKLSTADGQGLNLLDVEYTVLTPRIFQRFNPAVETVPVGTGEGLTFDEEPIAGGVRVDGGPIPATLCAGHFPDYPAAPVAIVMGQLCRAAGLAMCRHLDMADGRFRIEEGHVVAGKLARAGQRLVLEARYLKPVRGGHELQGLALADGETVGELVVTLSAHGPEPVESKC